MNSEITLSVTPALGWTVGAGSVSASAEGDIALYGHLSRLQSEGLITIPVAMLGTSLNVIG
jgi:hypothetical protein